MKTIRPKAEEAKEMYNKGVSSYYRTSGNNLIQQPLHQTETPDYFWKYLEVEENVYKIYKSKLGKLFYY